MIVKSVIAAAALCGAALVSAPASAMPIDNLAGAVAGNVEQVRVICGPGGCVVRPGYWHRYRGYGRAHAYRAYGLHRSYRRW
jgi:hypothetical protein